jgi:hypothetical protein
LLRGCARPARCNGDDRISQVLRGSPARVCRALRPRQGLGARRLRHLSAAAAQKTTTAPTFSFVSRLNHTACTLPVYASQPGLPPVHATLGSAWSPAFAGRGYPAGFLRKVSVTFSHGILPTQALPGAPSAEAFFQRRARRFKALGGRARRTYWPWRPAQRLYTGYTEIGERRERCVVIDACKFRMGCAIHTRAGVSRCGPQRYLQGGVPPVGLLWLRSRDVVRWRR